MKSHFPVTNTKDEWLRDCCLTQSEQFFSNIMARTCFWFIIRFWCLYWSTTDLDFYIISSLK